MPTITHGVTVEKWPQPGAIVRFFGLTRSRTHGHEETEKKKHQMGQRLLDTGETQPFQAVGTCGVDGIGPFRPEVHCGLAGLSPFSHQVPWGPAGLKFFRPPQVHLSLIHI